MNKYICGITILERRLCAFKRYLPGYEPVVISVVTFRTRFGTRAGVFTRSYRNRKTINVPITLDRYQKHMDGSVVFTMQHRRVRLLLMLSYSDTQLWNPRQGHMQLLHYCVQAHEVNRASNLHKSHKCGRRRREAVRSGIMKSVQQSRLADI